MSTEGQAAQKAGWAKAKAQWRTSQITPMTASTTTIAPTRIVPMRFCHSLMPAPRHNYTPPNSHPPFGPRPHSHVSFSNAWKDRCFAFPAISQG